MDKIDPNHDLVPTLRMMDGLLFDRAADEIEKWRDAYRKAVQTPAAELMVVGPGWHERFPVITAPIVIDGLLQVHVSDRRDDMADELTRLRAEVEDLTADRDSWIEQASARTADAVQFMQERDAARAEAEVLRADALKQVDCRQCKHATNRGCHSTALCERGELFEVTPPWQFYDAARAAQEGRR